MNSLLKVSNSIMCLGWLAMVPHGNIARSNVVATNPINKHEPNLAVKGVPMGGSATVVLEPRGNRLLLHLTVSAGSSSLEVEPWQVFRSTLANGSLLQLTTNGNVIEFTGPMAKRKSTPPDEWLRLAPGENLAGMLDITDLYAFLPGKHVYVIRYSTFAHSKDHQSQRVMLQSEPVSFVWQR